MGGELECWRSNPSASGDPVGVPEDRIEHGREVRPKKPLAVSVLLHFGGEAPPRRVDGFALAWTREHVRVQFVWRKEYFFGARELWVEAKDVQRRTIVPRHSDRRAEGKAGA